MSTREDTCYFKSFYRQDYSIIHTRIYILMIIVDIFIPFS